MKLTIKTLILLTLTISSQSVFSATWTWIGGISNNFDTKANWSTSSSSSRPQTDDHVIINAGATYQPQLTNSRTIKNFTINGGTFDTRRYILNVTSKVTVNGGTIRNSQTSNTGRINTVDFEINSGNVLSFASAGTLLVTVSGTMIFTSGIVQTTSDDLLIISDNATVSNANDNSHVNGPVRKIGNDAFTFPTGNGSVYAPIGISDFSSGSTAQHTTVYYTTTAPAGSLNGGGVLSSMETWSFTRSNASQISRITLFYNAAQRSGGIVDSSDLAVAVFNGTTWNPISGAATGSNSIGSVTTSSRVSGSIQGVTFSSPSGINALPIELLSFNAFAGKNHVSIHWSTTSELNNDFFTVEKSTDGQTWSAVAKMEGAMQSNSVLDYQVIDNKPVSGMQYYRLRQTDVNGHSTVSETVAVNFSEPVNPSVSLYPNPATDIVNIDFGTSPDLVTGVIVYNAAGQKVLEFNNFFSQISQIDISGIENGVYFLEISTISGVSKTRIIKN